MKESLAYRVKTKKPAPPAKVPVLERGGLAQRVKNLGKFAHPPKKRDDSLGEMDVNASDQLGVDQPGESGEMMHVSDRARVKRLLEGLKK